MSTNRKTSKSVEEFNKTNNNSTVILLGEASFSPIYEAGKAYYEFLQDVKSQSLENDDDYSAAFMMF